MLLVDKRRLVWRLNIKTAMKAAKLYVSVTVLSVFSCSLFAEVRAVLNEAGETNSTSPMKAPPRASKGVPAEDWEQIRKVYNERAYGIRTLQGESTLVASNPANRFRSIFDAQGFTVHSTDKSVGWSWGLKLLRVGRCETLDQLPEVARATASGSKVIYEWTPNVHEWFINTAKGLEHGLTLSERPKGSGKELSLRFAVHGTLHTSLANGEEGLSFVDPEKKTEIVTYDGLRVWDAVGTMLPARFVETATNEVELRIEDEGAQYPVTIDPTVSQEAYLKANSIDAGDNFGYSVAISNDRVVVGAPEEDSAATGVNGDDTDDSVGGSGAAYVFFYNGTTWVLEAYLKASTVTSNDRFGTVVDIENDSIVVTAPGEDGIQTNSGAAYVFERSNDGTWAEVSYLKAENCESNDGFGISAAISTEYLVVGAHGEDGGATTISYPDNNAESRAGAAYVFKRSSSGTSYYWYPDSAGGYLKADDPRLEDRFGSSVAIYGKTIVVGSPGEDSDSDGVVDVQSSNFSDPDTLNSGAAFVFDLVVDPITFVEEWKRVAVIKAPDSDDSASYGLAVAVYQDIVAVSGVYAGRRTVSVFERENWSAASSAWDWNSEALLYAPNLSSDSDDFALTISLDRDVLGVGAMFEDSVATNSGAAYIYNRQWNATLGAFEWNQTAALKASNPAASNNFGFPISVSESKAVVGSFSEDGTASNSGAAYIFGGIAPSLFIDSIGGANMEVKNQRLKGAPGQFRLLDDGLDGGLPFDEGVLLSTGSLRWTGLNDSEGGSDWIDWKGTGDADLQVELNYASSPETYDAAILEFDFKPAYSTVLINFVFASEEYLEWVGQYPDGMAIFVNGVNIALTPAPNPKTVGVDSINTGLNASLYNDNPVLAPVLDNIYDGNTVELEAAVTVTANQWHHIKIVIADVNDHIYDSAVVVKKASLRSEP